MAPASPASARPQKAQPKGAKEINRLFWAVVAMAVMAFVPFIQPLNEILRPKKAKVTFVGALTKGAPAEVTVSVVTADYPALTCASPQSFDGLRCELKDPKTPWPRDASAPPDDNRRTVIQPYRTYPDNALLFIAGLWSDPAVATRLHREPSVGVAPKKLVRFYVRCTVDVVSEPDDELQVQWSRTQNFAKWRDVLGQGQSTAWITRAKSCRLIDG